MIFQRQIQIREIRKNNELLRAFREFAGQIELENYRAPEGRKTKLYVLRADQTEKLHISV